MNPIPQIVQKFFPGIYSFPSQKGKLFFTFDDGPDPQTTPFVLKQLEQFNAKATFFCLGKKVEQTPGLYKQILDNGHSVGNHSYSHPNGFFCSTHEYLADVEKAKQQIDSRLFRPPYGKITPAQFYQLSKKYQLIFWSLLSMDFSPKHTYQDCFSLIKRNTQSGSIIVFHENDKSVNKLQRLLPDLLAYYSDSGFEFEKIG